MSERAVRDPTVYIRPDACNAALSFPDMTTRFECSKRGVGGKPHEDSGFVTARFHAFDQMDDEGFSVDWTDECPWAYRFDRVTGKRVEP